jgi:hypothetical protein
MAAASSPNRWNFSIIAAKLQFFIGHCGDLARDLHYICSLIDHKPYLPL